MGWAAGDELGSGRRAKKLRHEFTVWYWRGVSETGTRNEESESSLDALIYVRFTSLV